MSGHIRPHQIALNHIKALVVHVQAISGPCQATIGHIKLCMSLIGPHQGHVRTHQSLIASEASCCPGELSPPQQPPGWVRS